MGVDSIACSFLLFVSLGNWKNPFSSLGGEGGRNQFHQVLLENAGGVQADFLPLLFFYEKFDWEVGI